MMAMNKSKCTITEDGGKKYIKASEAIAYVEEKLNSSLGLPSYRTLRYYVTQGVVERPQHLGKEVYFESEYAMNVISLLRLLRPANPSLNQMKKIMLNVKRYNQFKEASKVLAQANASMLLDSRGKEVMLEQLATKKPSDINVKEIEIRTNELS